MISSRLRLAAALCAVAAVPAFASDHLDSPSVQADGRTDINDLYAFQSPVNPNNTVLILTVNPLAGEVSPTTFNSAAQYRLNIDNNGDALPDVIYTTTFAAPAGNTQAFTVTRSGASYATGTTGATTVVGGTAVTAGTYDDPFFFDLNGFNNGFAFTGDDFFAGHNTSAIVLEVPSSELGGPNIGVWASTTDASGANQIDRVGRPAINTALIPSARKDEFNQAQPSNDAAAFGSDVHNAIASLSNTANADALTPILLPDILTFDTSNSGGFLNGRKLGDDVIDAELNLLSAGAVTSDMVNGNDLPFLNVFPYLAAAQVVPEPAIGLSVLALVARRRTR